MSLIEQLNSIFCNVFKNPNLQISPETSANDIDGWDSLTHFKLILAVENNFNVSFNTRELMELKNVGCLIQLIETKITQ
ncbi:MAG: acyl carrier protein [Oligoflexia bacterium]|nr:acyl carrier protein [Oligoflexia bacterium]